MSNDKGIKFARLNDVWHWQTDEDVCTTACGLGLNSSFSHTFVEFDLVNAPEETFCSKCLDNIKRKNDLMMKALERVGYFGRKQ